MPGIRIGDECIAATASVVMKDMPSNCLIAGNPARVIEKNVHTGPWGYRVPAPTGQLADVKAD